MDISFVVPCFNEEETVPVFYDELLNECSDMDINYEIIFVDDGSKDNTLVKIKELARKDERVKYISFSRNFGKESAMVAGMEKSCGNFVVNVDVDLQDPLYLIKDMYKCVTEDGYDCAVTKRCSRDGENFIRAFLTIIFYKFIRLISHVEIVENERDYRLMNRKMVNAVLSMNEKCRFSRGIFNWVGFKTKYLEFEYIKRNHGVTKYSMLKLLACSLDGIISFSIVPLYFIALLGILFLLVSVFMFLILIYKKMMFGDTINTYMVLICLMFFASGIQLLCSGIIGQYISRTYLEAKQRPIYIVRESSIND